MILEKAIGFGKKRKTIYGLVRFPFVYFIFIEFEWCKKNLAKCYTFVVMVFIPPLLLLCRLNVEWHETEKIERKKQDTLVLKNIAIWNLVFQIQSNTLFTFFFFLFFFFCLIKLSTWNGNNKIFYEKYGFWTIFIKFYWKRQQYDKSYCMFTHPLLLPLLIWERAHEIENKN